MRIRNFLVLLALPLWAQQGIRQQAQSINPALSEATPQGFHGTTVPGAVAGNLSGDIYLYSPGSGNPAVVYVCTAPYGTSAPACTSATGLGQWQQQSIPSIFSMQYDVVGNYHAAGSNTTTTGTMVSGQNTLTVVNTLTFSSNEGVLAVGCAATSSANPNGNLVASIVSISGNVFSLSASATANCNGVLVAHDDTTAANNANADCMNNGGGLIWYRSTGVDGIYKFSAPATSTTGILTWPQNMTASNPVHCRIEGEALGNITPGNLTLETGGVSWDFSNAPNVANTSAMAVAPYVPLTSGNFTTELNSLDVEINNINVWLPAHTSMNGLLLYNTQQASVGRLYVGPKADSSSTWLQPVAGTTGIFMPGWLNDVQQRIGMSAVYGFDHCISPGEHVYLDGPYLVDCNVAMYLYTAHDLISGHVKIEQVPLMMEVDAGVTNRIPIDMSWDNETCITTGPTCNQSWQVRGADDIVDANNKLVGSLRYKIKDGSENYDEINLSGGANVAYCNTGIAAVSNVCQK